MSFVAENVRRIRESRNWSQEQLAEMLNASVRTVQRLERGERVSEETLRDVAVVFEVDRELLDVDARVVQARLEQALADLKATHREVSLHIVEHGCQLSAMLGTHAYLHDCQSTEDRVREESASFEAYLQDLDVVWSEMTPEDRRQAEKDLEEHLRRFAEVGYCLYATVDRRHVKMKDDPPDRPAWDCDVLITCAVPRSEKPFMSILVPRAMAFR